MPLSEVQRRVPPLAQGTPFLQWWMSEDGHQPVTQAETAAWLVKVERERREAERAVERWQEAAKRERKRIR